MDHFTIVFGAIVATVIVSAVLYDQATPHVSASGPAPPKSSITESKTSSPANVAKANAASESAATTASDASNPRDEPPTSGPVSTSRPQATAANKAIKSPSKSAPSTSKSSSSATGSAAETQNPVDLNGNPSPSGDTVIPKADQPSGSSTDNSTSPKEGG